MVDVKKYGCFMIRGSVLSITFFLSTVVKRSGENYYLSRQELKDIFTRSM